MKEQFEGKLEQMDGFIIYLNIDQLKNGQYTLKLIQENQVIKIIPFTKSNQKGKTN